MTTEVDNVHLIRRWFQEVWNERREESIDELFHAQVKGHGLGDGPIDFEGFKGVWHTFLETFPDFHCEVHDAFGDGDMSACRFTVSGTHRGSGLGVAPTGKTIRFDGMTITRWRDGKIIEGWNVIDMAALYRQIGVLNV